MCKIDAVVFDLGQVLVNFDRQPFIDFLMSRGTQIKSTKEFEEHTQLIDYECGRISDDQFLENMQRILTLPTDKKMLSESWREIFTAAPQMEELLVSIKKNHATYILSNTNTLHWEYIRTGFKTLQLADDTITSFEAGAMKPESTIYHAAVKKFSLTPEKSVFIDDLVENVEGAKSLGWHGIHHINYESTVEQLVELGVTLA